MPATLSFRQALSEGIASGTFVDTKIILFSRRNSSGRVYRPKALYASSRVLKSVPYFDDRESTPYQYSSRQLDKALSVLFGNFLEAGSREFGNNLDDDDESADGYDYLSDSDLEDDGETKVDVALKGVLRMAAPPRDAMKDVLRKVTPRKGTLKRVLKTDSLRRLGSGVAQKPPRERYSEQAYRGKVVKIQDMAFITHVHSTCPRGTLLRCL